MPVDVLDSTQHSLKNNKSHPLDCTLFPKYCQFTNKSKGESWSSVQGMVQLLSSCYLYVSSHLKITHNLLYFLLFESVIVS